MSHVETTRAHWRGALATSMLLGIGCGGTAASPAQPAVTADAQTKPYQISPQALGTALQEFAAQAGVQLLFSAADVAGKKTDGLQGSFSREQALQRLLAGSGLVFEFPKEDTLIVHPAIDHPNSNPTSWAGDVPTAQTPTPTATPAGERTVTSDGAAGAVDGRASNGAGSQPLADLTEVVVTGRAGVEQRTKQETSYSLTTIDQKTLRLQGPTSVTESLKSVPGFWVEASGGEASGNVRARGIPVDGFGSITLLEDGMPVQHDPALGYLNGDQAFRLDETIDHIEVVRGGPSSIFYSNAPAGAVNYIPRGVGDHAEGIVKYTAGDYGLNRIDAWYGAPVGEWKLSLGGFYRYDDGIRDPGFHADNGGQFRVTLARDFDGGKVSFDVKRVDDIVALDLGIPMRTYPDGEIRAAPGFNGNFGTIAGPETELIRMKTATGTGRGPDYLFDNTLGTHVERTQLSGNLQFNLGDGYVFDDHVRYNDTGTVRNGVYPNTLQSASSFLAQSAQTALIKKYYPSASGLQLRYVDSPATVFDVAHQNGNGLMIIGGLRGLEVPVKELMNDARLMRKFDVGGQSHDATLGFYVANVSQDFSRYSSTALLDVQDNARLLDLVAVDSTGKVVGTLTDHGIYHYGYEWADANGQATTTAFYLADEWQVTDPFRIDAGVRWEQVHLTSNIELRQTVDLGTSDASQIIEGTGQFVHYDQTFSKVGWTVGANWQFTERSGTFARYTSAFRLPSLSGYTTAGPTAANPIINMPITQTMGLGEVGYKYANSWTELYATAFWTKYNNVGMTNNVFDPNNAIPPFQQTQYAHTKTYGLELEGGFYPLEWFDLSYSATLEQPKYDGLVYTDNVSGKPVLRNYDGNQLIRVPKVSVRIVPGLNLFGQRLRVQAAWEYEGARYVDTANSVVLPAYNTLNATARFSVTDRLDLFGYVDNVTNSLGLTEGNPRQGEVQSADAGANTFIARPILGRAYRLALMYRF